MSYTCKQIKKQWIIKEIELLKQTYATTTMPESLSKYLKATPEEIVAKAVEIGIEQNVAKIVRYSGIMVRNQVILKRHRGIPPEEIMAIPSPAGGYDVIINNQTVAFNLPFEQINPVETSMRQTDLKPEENAKVGEEVVKPVNSPEVVEIYPDIRKPWDEPKKNPLIVGEKTGEVKIVSKDAGTVSKQEQVQTKRIDTRFSVTTNASVAPRMEAKKEETAPVIESQKQGNQSPIQSPTTSQIPIPERPVIQPELQVKSEVLDKETDDKVVVSRSQETPETGKGKKSLTLKVYTLDVENMLARKYPRGNTKELAEKIGVSKRALIQHMSKMGIKKDTMVVSIKDENQKEIADFVAQLNRKYINGCFTEEEKKEYEAIIQKSNLTMMELGEWQLKMSSLRFLAMYQAEKKFGKFISEATTLTGTILTSIAKFESIKVHQPETMVFQQNNFKTMIMEMELHNNKYLTPEERQVKLNLMKTVNMRKRQAMGWDSGQSPATINQRVN